MAKAEVVCCARVPDPGRQRVQEVRTVSTILVIIRALLSDTDAQFIDVGADYYATRNNPERKARHHIRELQALAYSVTLNPAA